MGQHQSIDTINSETDKRVKELRRKGHTCISIDTQQIVKCLIWCGQEVCDENTKKYVVGNLA